MLHKEIVDLSRGVKLGINSIRIPKVTIVIPSFNSTDLFECIDSVLNQGYPNFEIIVVDNSTRQNIWRKLQVRFASSNKIKLLKPDNNTGVTGGRNLGVRYSNKDSKYVLFLDHDILLEKDALFELVKVGESDPQIGIVTGKILYFENPEVIWSAGTSINLLTGQIHFNGGKDVGQFDEIKEVQVSPSVILTKRRLLEKIGGFDDLFFANYEDTDFCFRARKVGFKIFYTPYARAYHMIPLNSNISNNRLLARAYPIAKNRIIFMKRHSKCFGLFLFFLPVYIAYYTFLSLRVDNIDAVKNFLQGTVSGMSIALGEKKR
jgi:GT2 family glycosyltransferase